MRHQHNFLVHTKCIFMSIDCSISPTIFSTSPDIIQCCQLYLTLHIIVRQQVTTKIYYFSKSKKVKSSFDHRMCQKMTFYMRHHCIGKIQYLKMVSMEIFCELLCKHFVKILLFSDLFMIRYLKLPFKPTEKTSSILYLAQKIIVSYNKCRKCF